MKRTTQSLSFVAGSIAAALMATSVFGQTLTILETHVGECVVPDSTLTNWDQICEIPLYNPDDHAGSLLDSVMVTLIGTSTSQVEVMANTDTTLNPSVLPPLISNPEGVVGATVSASWTVGGSALALNAIPVSPIVETQDVPLAANEMTVLANLSGNDEAILTTNGVTNTAVYLDPTVDGTGTFNVSLSAVGFGQPPFSSGGNLDLGQATDAGAQFMVQYKTYEVLPEPSAGLMAAFAFLGILGMRRKR